jgi:hypothetical protein
MPDVTFTLSDDAAGGPSTGDPARGPLQCFGSLFRACFSTLPTKGLTVVGPDSPGSLGNSDSLGPDIDTDGSPSCDPAQNDACVVVAQGFSVYDAVRGHGSRPLVLISTGNAEFRVFAGGAVDVSSRHNGKVGAGALTAQQCQAAGPAAAAGQYGGFGGTFQTMGGQGGTVGSGEGGTPAPDMKFPDRARGGCPGGAGGSGASSGDGGGAGGEAGGAVVIVAASVVVDGQINASGAAGRGGLTGGTGGGGGGGAGGLIVIEARSLSGNGWLFANGGGGGQGGAFGVEGAGDDGRESTGPVAPGTGGQNASATRLGGHGGNGSSGNFLGGLEGAAARNASRGGGGGGGGGAGWIKAPGAAATLTLSPPLPAS